MSNVIPQIDKYKLSRRGRKLQVPDETKTLLALPKDVSERTWAEILRKEEDDLVVFDIREEILEEALRVGYERYMDRQVTSFTAHCAAKAWLKLINWHFFRHDPGEEPSAAPACFIPKRTESWIPDIKPESSPKDSWGRHGLEFVENIPDEILVKWPSNSSIDMPVIQEIPKEFRFPGKVLLPVDSDEKLGEIVSKVGLDSNGEYYSMQDSSESEDLVADSELLQKVTNYSTDALNSKESMFSALKTTTPVDGSLQGAGDSTLCAGRTRRKLTKQFSSKRSFAEQSRSSLPPLIAKDSRSRHTIISDCRLRSHRLDTQYEITSERMDTPPVEGVKRK